MSETHFCGALILAITFLLIIRYSLRMENAFFFTPSRNFYGNTN